MNSIIDEVLTKDSTDVKLPDLDRSTDKANNTGDFCESVKSTKSIFATEESKNVCPQEEEEEHVNTPTTKVDETIVKTEEYEETAANKSKTIIDNDKNINPTINKECSESKYNKRGDIVKKEPEEQTMMLSNINLDREFVIINEENHKSETGDKNRQSYDVSEPPSAEETEDFKEEVEDIAITGEQEIYEIIVPNANGTKAKYLTDYENKEQFISEKSLFEDLEDEINCKIEGALYVKETSKNCDVDEKYEESHDNKSFLNNDVLDLYETSSKYSEEDETEFITLKEDELNTIHDLYKPTDKSTSINSNVFESLKSTKRIVAAATEEIKAVCPQEEEQINAAMTKIYETIVNIQENKEKAANNSKTIVDNDKNIKVEDVEIPGDEGWHKTIPPDENDGGEDSVYNYQKPQSIYLSTVLLQPETTNTTVYSTSSSSQSPYLSSNSITSSGLIRKRQHEEDEDECIQDKSKAQKQQVNLDESSFVQSIATSSQRLTTSVKRFKRPTKAGINAPTESIRLNVTTAATVTSIEQYTENNDVEDLLQATWIEKDETQISDDDEAKKQHQQQTQQQYQFSSSSSATSSSTYSERLHKRNREGIIIGDDDCNENNENPSLVSALAFPKNVDPQMFISDENKDRCVICNQDFIGRLVYHYVTEHRGCEIYNSRLSPSQIKLVEQGRCEVSNVFLYKKYKYYKAFCIFCQENLSFSLLDWCEHFARRHTGEFAYSCTGCGLRKPRRHDFRKRQAQECIKAKEAQDYFRSSKCLSIEANVCTLCNYLQLHRSNIERHLHTQHNIEHISPEHMQTIALLSIDDRRWNKSDAAPSLPPSSHVPNTEKTPPETNPLTIKNRFEKFTNSDKATGDLNNSEGSPSLLLPSHTEKDQQGIIMGVDDEINENSALVSTLDWPKNVDTQMFINNENKDRCVICNEDFVGRFIVHHYVNYHRGCEIYNSRLSPSQIKLVEQGRCEVSNVFLYKKYKYYEAFCIFCQKNLCLILQYWYDHFTRHTGEFAYRCTGCGLRKPRRSDFRKHQAQECHKAKVAQDYFCSSKGLLPIEANVCNLCNYVQLRRSSIEKHLHVQHNVKEILTEHIHTIVLLPISSSTTSTNTGGKIDSTRWNKTNAAPSLPSSSQDCNASVFDNDDNDDVVTFDKILPKESSSQTNPPTINNNKFQKSTNCYRATRHLTNVDGSTSLTLLSENASNTDVIDNVRNHNNVTFEKMVKEETWRQANPTINNTFKESTNSHKVICSKILTLGDVSAADAYRKKKLI